MEVLTALSLGTNGCRFLLKAIRKGRKVDRRKKIRVDGRDSTVLPSLHHYNLVASIAHLAGHRRLHPSRKGIFQGSNLGIY